MTIYGLVDLRYIGQTKDRYKRYWRHCHPTQGSRHHRDLWIRLLAHEGLKPELVELEHAQTRDDADMKERFWIASLRAAGAILLNFEDGGETTRGRLGQKLTMEHRAKISAAHIGIGHTAEARAKMSAARKGRKHSPETIEKMRLAQERHHATWKMPAEMRAQIADRMRDLWKVRRLQPKPPRTLCSHPLKITHGTTTAYRHGCRCEACTENHTKHERERRKRRQGR